MTILKLVMAALFMASTQNALAAEKAPVQAKIAFTYQKFPLRMKLYEVPDKLRFSIGRTENLTPEQAKKGGWFTKPHTTPANDTITVQPGKNKAFVLVLDNSKGKGDLFFMAVPHTAHPAEASVGHTFECLCNHSIFRVKKGSIWYRVVRLELSPDYQHKKLELTHTILPVEEKDALSTYRDRVLE